MKGTKKALLMTLCLAGSAVVAPMLAMAGVGIGVDIDLAPPAQRVEVVPAPRPGYVWAPGYWEYRDHAHVWVPGRWELRPRAHARWVSGHWRHTRHGWYWVEGHWR